MAKSLKALIATTQDAVTNSRGHYILQGGSNMTGTDLYVNKPHCVAAVRP